jgi:integrase
MPNIRKRSEHSYTITYDEGRNPKTGKRQQRTVTVRGTKKEAEQEARRILHTLETGTYVKSHNMTTGEWLAQWIKTLQVTKAITEGSLLDYKVVVIPYLIPALGPIPLSRLQPRHLSEYYTRALGQGRIDGKGGLSRITVIFHHQILSRALSDAVNNGLLIRNIAPLANKPRAEPKQIQVMDDTDIPKFIKAAADTPYSAFFITLLFTGLRRGELVPLKRRNLDLLGAELRVVETARRVADKIIIKEPKSPSGQRRVSLLPSNVGVLRDYLKQQDDQRVRLGMLPTGDDLVFSGPDGRMWDPGRMTRGFTKILKRAGLPHIRLHDLRHTHATMMLKMGIHPKIVSERLGHSKINITIDRYSHVVAGLQEAVTKKLDHFITQNLGVDVVKMLAEDSEVDVFRDEKVEMRYYGI